MIIFTIFIVLTIVITIILYVIKTEKSNRLEFSSLSTLLQTIFVFVTLWITVFTIQSSSSDTQLLFKNLNSFSNQFSQMESSLGEVSIKLRELPLQIKKFSNSIDSLNEIINQQSADFKTNTKYLNKTISDLSNSVKDYENNIDTYSQQLKTIVDLTDKQLSIWKEQQRVLLDEFSRRPILSIQPKEYKIDNDTCKINDLVISNDGNIEANLRVLFLLIPSNGIINFDSPKFEFYKKQDNYDLYRFLPFDTNIEIIVAGSDIIIPCKVSVLSSYKNEIYYRIDFISKYNSGKVTKSIQIK